jgi:ribonuclease PH
MMATSLPDAAAAATLRPLSCELSTLHNCDGSAEWKSGKTNVLAAVHGPMAPRIAQYEDAAQCVVSVSIKTMDMAVPDWEIFIQRVLTACIQTHLYPRCVIAVTLQILHADGSELAALLHAAVSALLDASIDLHVLPVAVTVHPPTLTLDPSNQNGGGNGSDDAVVFVFGTDEQILACTGLFGTSSSGGGWLECCQRAERAVPAIRAFWRLVAEQKMERESQTLWAQSS